MIIYLVVFLKCEAGAINSCLKSFEQAKAKAEELGIEFDLEFKL